MSQKKNPLFNLTKIQALSQRDFKLYTEFYQNEIATPINNLTKNKMDPNLSSIIKNYVIMRFTTLIEDYIRNIVINLVDTKSNYSTLFTNNEITISVSHLETIKKSDITVGKVIASNFNFQDPKNINFVISKLLGIPFFEIAEKMVNNGTMISNFIKDNKMTVIPWKFFLNVFEERNKVTHTINHNITFGVTEFGLLSIITPMFLAVLEGCIAITEKGIIEKWPETFEEFDKLVSLSQKDTINKKT